MSPEILVALSFINVNDLTVMACHLKYLFALSVINININLSLNSSKGVYGDIIRIHLINSQLMPFYVKILTPSSMVYN